MEAAPCTRGGVNEGAWLRGPRSVVGGHVERGRKSGLGRRQSLVEARGGGGQGTTASHCCDRDRDDAIGGHSDAGGSTPRKNMIGESSVEGDDSVGDAVAATIPADVPTVDPRGSNDWRWFETIV